MTIKQKAAAFDLIYNGTATGMSLFWERFSETQKLIKQEGQDASFRIMGQLAAEEAAREILDRPL